MGRRRSASDRYWSCSRKIKYRSNTSASGAIIRMVERGMDRPGFKLRAYYCRYCKRWHVGHKKLAVENVT